MASESVDNVQTVRLRTAFRRVRSSVKLGLATTFVLLLIVVTAGLWFRYDDVLSEGKRDAERLVDVLFQQLAIQIDSVEGTLLELAAHSRFIGGPNASGQEWMPVLNVVSAGRHGIEALMVTDASGRVTYSSLPIFMGQSRADSNSFRTLSKNPRSDDLIADEPIRSVNDQKIVVPLARVIRTPQAEFEGMVIAQLAPDKMRDFYSAANVGENGIVWLLKLPEFVLLREPRSATPNDEPWPTIALTASNSGQADAVVGPLERDGPDYLTVYRPHDGTGLIVAVSLPLADVLAPWWNEVYAAVALCVGIGIILFASAMVVARSTRTGEATLDDVGGAPA